MIILQQQYDEKMCCESNGLCVVRTIPAELHRGRTGKLCSILRGATTSDVCERSKEPASKLA